MKCQAPTKLHPWFGGWVPLAALSVNFLGKCLFFN